MLHENLARIPPDLYRDIAWEVKSKGDLLNLLVVSKSFHPDAEWALYHEINFASVTNDSKNQFLNRIIICPRVALWVHSLTLLVDHQLIPLLNAILRVTINLRSLTMEWGYGWPVHETALGEVLDGITLHLHNLHLHTPLFFINSAVGQFYSSQRNSLREFSLPLWEPSGGRESTSLVTFIGRNFPELRTLGQRTQQTGFDIMQRGRIERLSGSVESVTVFQPAFSVHSLSLPYGSDYACVTKLPNLRYLQLSVVGS